MTNEDLIEKFERENITLASFSARTFAYLIDEVLVSILFALIYLDQFVSTSSTEETIQMINSLTLYVLLLKIAYQAFFVWMYGATLGKIFLKVRIISTTDLEKPTFLFALSRACFRVVSELLFYLGFLWAMLNPKRETWHDKVASTLVVNAR